MASSSPEQLWTAPRAAKERETLFEAGYRKRLGRVLAGYWPAGGNTISRTEEAPGLGPNQATKIGCLKSV